MSTTAGCSSKSVEVTYGSPTTVMMRNIPNDYTRDDLCNLLNGQGFRGIYDFVYLPRDFRRGGGFGYAFINMISHKDAEAIKQHLTGFNSWTRNSKKVVEVRW